MSVKQGADATEIGSSQLIYFNWKKHCDGVSPAEIFQLKQLEDENATLAKLVADLRHHKEMLQDIIRRQQ